MNSFFITGLPRSRTKWFSEYFTQAGAPCIHEATGFCTESDVFSLVEAGVGISDTGLWSIDLAEKYPDVPLVVIRRALCDVKEALEAIGLPWHDILLLALNVPRAALVVDYDDIDDRLEEIHAYCTDRPFNPDLANMMINTVIKQNRFVIDQVHIDKAKALMGEG